MVPEINVFNVGELVIFRGSRNKLHEGCVYIILEIVARDGAAYSKYPRYPIFYLGDSITLIGLDWVSSLRCEKVKENQ
jgi:hypothetical protein